MNGEPSLNKEVQKNILLFSELTTGQLEQITFITKLEKYFKNNLLFFGGDFYGNRKANHGNIKPNK